MWFSFFTSGPSDICPLTCSDHMQGYCMHFNVCANDMKIKYCAGGILVCVRLCAQAWRESGGNIRSFIKHVQ